MSVWYCASLHMCCVKHFFKYIKKEAIISWLPIGLNSKDMWYVLVLAISSLSSEKIILVKSSLLLYNHSAWVSCSIVTRQLLSVGMLWLLHHCCCCHPTGSLSPVTQSSDAHTPSDLRLNLFKFINQLNLTVVFHGLGYFFLSANRNNLSHLVTILERGWGMGDQLASSNYSKSSPGHSSILKVQWCPT